MIKLASLVPYKILPPVKGGERHIYYFLMHLAKFANLKIFTVAENTTKENEDLNFYDVLGSTRNKLRYLNPLLYFKLKKGCRQHGATHIIIEHPYYGWLGWMLKKFAGIKFMLRSHNIEGLRFRSLGKWWWGILYNYERMAHRWADGSFFITEEDRAFAIKHFKLNPSKCFLSTYGIEATEPPSTIGKSIHKENICRQLGILPETNLILFNGILNYGPNLNAVDTILQHIQPVLNQKLKLPFKIIICGSGLPESYHKLKEYEKYNIIFCGFVEDMQQYLLGADIFINPIIEGGGIKTKLVEALAANTPAVSFKTGGIGIPISITGEHLILVPDKDHEAFAEAIITLLHKPRTNIPATFFEYFNWDNIANRVLKIAATC